MHPYTFATLIKNLQGIRAPPEKSSVAGRCVVALARSSRFSADASANASFVGAVCNSVKTSSRRRSASVRRLRRVAAARLHNVGARRSPRARVATSAAPANAAAATNAEDMSARVFNPVVMELRRAMRGPGGGSAVADATALAAMPTAAAAAASAPDFGLQAPARVRRNLFGPVDHEETRRFVERELAAINKRDEDLYEFDFSRERPREGPTRRFAWERVQPGGVPESYALRRLAFLGAAAATATVAAAAATAASSAAAAAPDASAAAAMPPPAAVHDAAAAQAIATAAADPAEAAATPAEPPCTPAPARTRQSLIGEFMRTRKRPSSGSCDAKMATTTKRSSSPSPTPSKVRKAATTLEATGTSRLS